MFFVSEYRFLRTKLLKKKNGESKIGFTAHYIGLILCSFSSPWKLKCPIALSLLRNVWFRRTRSFAVVSILFED